MAGAVPSSSAQSVARIPSNGWPRTAVSASSQASRSSDEANSWNRVQSVPTVDASMSRPWDFGRWSEPSRAVPRERRATDAVECRLEGAIRRSGQSAVAHTSLDAPAGCIAR